MSKELAIYDAMVLAIDQCYKVDEVKDLRDKALALEEYARQANNTQAERKAAEIRIRAERKAGALLDEIEKSKGGRPPVTNNSLHGAKSFPAAQKPTPYQQVKEQANISDNQAARWQQLARLPHGDFEGRLHDPLVSVPTTTGILAPDRPKAPPDDATHIWGDFVYLDRDGYLDKDLNELIRQMSPKMRAEMAVVIPKLQAWLNTYKPYG